MDNYEKLDDDYKIRSECTWSEIEDSSEWDTSCGDLFTLIEGTPKENGMKFCCYCGKSLVQRLYERESEDDEED